MRVAQILLVFLLAGFLLTACSGKGGKFVGQWQGKEVTITIKKDGDFFVFESSGRPGEKFKASPGENGALMMIMPVAGIPHEFALVLSEDGQTLYAMGEEFKRVEK